MKLTDSQWKAVNLRGKNILVSASAGTGKTSAMIARVVELVMGRSSEKASEESTAICAVKHTRIPVRRILLLTYTRAAATEMRSRLTAALIAELNSLEAHSPSYAEDKDYIKEQIDAVPMSDVSTIHAFASVLIRSYYHELDINPMFEVAEESDEAAYTADALESVFRKAADTPELNRLRAVFNVRMKDDALKEAVVKLYSFAEASGDAGKWLEETALMPYVGKFEDSIICSIFLNNIRKESGYLLEQAIDAAAASEESEPGYAEWIKGIAAWLSPYTCVKDIEGLRALSEKGAPDLNPKLRLKKNSPIKKIRDYIDKLLEKFQNYGANDVKFLSEERISLDLASGRQTASDMLFMVRAFGEEFTVLKRADNKLTYQDLESLTARLTATAAASEIAGKYDYILVDEYQDVNYLQEKIISALSRAGNLFMVGDSKQSIYRFRQAVPEIFLSKNDRYRQGDGGEAESFNNNFRSRAGILDYVNAVFSRMMTRSFGGVNYLRDAMLEAEADEGEFVNANPYPAVSILTYTRPPRVKAEPAMEVFSVEKCAEFEEDESAPDAEAAIIAEEINKLYGSPYYDRKTKSVGKLTYSDMALVIRSRSDSAAAMVRAIEKRGIPLNTDDFVREEKSPEIRILVNLLRASDNFLLNIPMAAALRSYFGKFTDSELAELRLQTPEAGTVFDMLKNSSGNIKHKADKFLALLEKCRFRASYMPVFELLGAIVEETGYDKYLLAGKGGKIKYAGLKAFLQSLKGKTYAESAGRFLYHFDNYVERVEKPASPAAVTDSVTVCTMHAVKGLEYPVVFAANTHAPFKRSDDEYAADRELGLGFMSYDAKLREKRAGIVFSVMKGIREFKEREDNLNLLYVALTRAKNHLIVTGAENKDGVSAPVRAEEAGNFLSLIYAGADRAFIKSFTPDETGELMGAFRYANAPRPAVVFREPELIYKEALSRALNYAYPYKDSASTGIKYSVSAINKSAVSEEVYVPPLFEDNRRELGTANHKVMQHIRLDAESLQAVRAEIQLMAEIKILTAEEAAAVNSEEILKCLKSPVMEEARRGLALREQTFLLRLKASELIDTASQDEVLLQGTIDLLILGKSNVIVDYKRTSITDDQLIKAKYGRQVRLYAMAAERIKGIKIDRKVVYLFGQDREICIE